MLDVAFLPRRPLLTTTRVRSLTQSAAPITAAEIAVLLFFGVLAACSVALIRLEIRVPGHAILRAAFPLVLGLAIVPRRSSGLIMGVAAGITALIFKLTHIGTLQPPAVAAMLLLGPAIDLALSAAPRGWRLYARFALAGLTANLLAFAMRWILAWLHLDVGSGGRFRSSIGISVFSFAVCGALAGLISGLVFFRASPRDSTIPNQVGGQS